MEFKLHFLQQKGKQIIFRLVVSHMLAKLPPSGHMTSHGRVCEIATSHRRQCDIITTSCACCELLQHSFFNSDGTKMASCLNLYGPWSDHRGTVIERGVFNFDSYRNLVNKTCGKLFKVMSTMFASFSREPR